ncbi:Ig-like domain-containing protein [Streptomyces sp. NPDC001436]
MAVRHHPHPGGREQRHPVRTLGGPHRGGRLARRRRPDRQRRPLFDGDEPLGTVSLTDGRAVFHSAVLRPGTHAFTARYEGDSLHRPASSPETVSVTVGFSRPCLTAPHAGPLTVAAGESICLGAGAQQSGPVRIEPGGALAASGASFTGRFSADRALAVSLCGVHVDGPLTVRETVGPVIVCDGSTVTGAVTLESNAGGTTVSGTTITGPLRCEGNTPAPPAAGRHRAGSPLRPVPLIQTAGLR